MSEEVDMFLTGKAAKKSPLVLLGAVSTAGVLVGGLLAFKKGNKDLSQSLMRARVLLQGATVAAMVVTSGAFLVPTTKEVAPTR